MFLFAYFQLKVTASDETVVIILSFEQTCLSKQCRPRVLPRLISVYTVCRSASNISNTSTDSGTDLYKLRGGSNKKVQSMFWAEIWKISEFFHLKTFQFFVVKFSIYLNRRVFVMVRSYGVQYLEYIRYTFCFNGNCVSPNTIDLQQWAT